MRARSRGPRPVAQQPAQAGARSRRRTSERRRRTGRARTTRSADGGQPVQLGARRRPAAAGSRGGGPPSCRRPCRRRNRPAHRSGGTWPKAGSHGSLRGPFGEVVEHHGRPPGAAAGPDDRGELRTPAQAGLRGQHVRRRASRDPCGDGREDRPARAGPHPQPEPVGLRPTPGVRLERALAHEVLPLHDIGGAHFSVDGRAGRRGARCDGDPEAGHRRRCPPEAVTFGPAMAVGPAHRLRPA